MDSLKEKLAQLDSILINHNAPLVRLLNPGLSKEEILSFFERNNINVKESSSLVTLYEWHNGVKSVYGHYDDEVNLIPFGTFFNLEEMLLMREVFREMAESDFENLDDYLPFLGTGESDMFILNLNTGEVSAYQPMIQVYGEIDFHSIKSLINCILECFDTKAYEINSEQGILIDMDKYNLIRKKHLLQINYKP